MKKRFLLLSSVLLIAGLVTGQQSLPYKSYIIAGKVHNPQRTASSNYVVLQEVVAGYPTEYDLLLYSISDNLMYNITEDRKSTYNVSPPVRVVSPDGNWALYYSFKFRKNSVYIKNLWSGETITVTENADPYFLCAWSPDGTKILFGEESGLINTPNTTVRVFDIATRSNREYTLTDNEEHTIIRGHSQPAWAFDGRGFFYNTYLKKDGDYIFHYDLEKNVLRKVVKGTKGRMNLKTGELLYIDNHVLMGYSTTTKRTRVIFDEFPVQKDEEATYDISIDGDLVVLTAKVGEFASGSNINNLFVVDLQNLTSYRIQMPEKSLGYPQFISNTELVFQIKGLVQAGKEQNYALENKLFKSDIEGQRIQQLFAWD
ncbi:MAG: hypothetical protein HUU10_00415 [Bacteroidetes bacterium]|nr:hypothetical protein [Bacteroidota bacterium]